jgi:hypothetical protein
MILSAYLDHMVVAVVLHHNVLLVAVHLRVPFVVFQVGSLNPVCKVVLRLVLRPRPGLEV